MDNIEKYFSNPALNSSKLKSFITKGIAGLTDPSDEYAAEKTALKLGSAVDTILTKGDFNSKYLVSNTPMASLGDKPFKIIQETFDHISHMDLSNNKVQFEGILTEIVIPIARKYEYKGNIKDVEKYKAALIADCKDYFNFKLTAGKREIITYEEFMKIQATVMKFNQLKHFNLTDVKTAFQKDFYAKFEGIDCKVLVDYLIVKGDNVYLFDLKTLSEPVTKFKYSFQRFLYNVQGVFYTEVVKLALPNKRVHNMSFLAASLEDNLPAQEFTLTDELYNATLNGSENYRFSGIKEAISKIKKHYELEEFKLNLDELVFKQFTKTPINIEFKYDFK